MRTVDYNHVLQILENYAKENKSAAEARLALIFVFGE